MDSVVPLIPLQLDKERYLRLDISAMCAAEMDLSAHWGKDMSIYAALLESPIRLNDLAIILLHALRHSDVTLSLPEVKGMMNHASMPSVLEAVTLAWTKANQTAEPGAEGDATTADPQPAVLTGDSSGPLPTSN